MSKRIASMSRRPLAAALFVALIAPGMAFAQSAKEKQLEARVAQLEQQVQALLSAQQQQQTALVQQQSAIAQTQIDLDTDVLALEVRGNRGFVIPVHRLPVLRGPGAPKAD